MQKENSEHKKYRMEYNKLEIDRKKARLRGIKIGGFIVPLILVSYF